MVHREELAALREKYTEMRRLRQLPSGGEAPRAALARLAANFPGALREIDDLPLEEISARIERLAAAEADPGRAEAWMEASVRFHASMRGVLAAKRWLVEQRPEPEDVEHAFVAALASGKVPFADDARSWSGSLASVASPPGGRLSNLAFARVAEAMKLEPADARLLVFGAPRRARRA